MLENLKNNDTQKIFENWKYIFKNDKDHLLYYLENWILNIKHFNDWDDRLLNFIQIKFINDNKIYIKFDQKWKVKWRELKIKKCDWFNYRIRKTFFWIWCDLKDLFDASNFGTYDYEFKNPFLWILWRSCGYSLFDNL